MWNYIYVQNSFLIILNYFTTSHHVILVMVSKVLSNDSGRFLDLQEFFVLKLWFLSQTVKIKIFWPPNVITDFHEKNKINKSYINKIMLPQNRT